MVVACMVLVWCCLLPLHFAASSLTRFWSTESWLCLEKGCYRGGVLGVELVVAVVVGVSGRGEDCERHKKQAGQLKAGQDCTSCMMMPPLGDWLIAEQEDITHAFDSTP